MSGQMLRTVDSLGGPPCPNSLPPVVNAAHQAVRRTLDAFYASAERDANDELPPVLDKAYTAAAYGEGGSGRMRAYIERHQVVLAGRVIILESFFWRCQACGLILTAQRSDQLMGCE